MLLMSTLVAPGSAAGTFEPSQDVRGRIDALDVFQVEFAADPQISPDGEQIVYVRTFMDIMSDTQRSNLWLIRADGSDQRPLTSGNRNDFGPRWSQDGTQLLYASSVEGSVQLYLRWMDTGQTAQLTNLQSTPDDLAFSPDGRWIAFSMFVPDTPETFVSMPPRPDGAEWAPTARFIDELQYRADGRYGFLEDGYTQLFLLPAEGGTPRQITSGPYNHGGRIAWAPDSQSFLFSANRHDDWRFDPADSEIHEVAVADGAIRTLTQRHGPDTSPAISPDGSMVAYLGNEERYQGYQVTQLYVMDRDGSNGRTLAADLDRDVQAPVWAADGRGIYFQYDSEGNTSIAYVSLEGEVGMLTGDVGGLSLGRPYAGGSFSLSRTGRFAFTHSGPDHPADVGVGEGFGGGGEERPVPARRLTRLNDDLFGHKEIADVEEIWFDSSFDGRRIQGWIAKPPGFDPKHKYPLILEIHGGPFTNYGPRFSMEIQLFAAAGFVVLYTNPRGSTSYGHEFGNLIHHAYPSQDYDDLMSGVDAVIERGYVDPDNLFVTGGSGGGVLTSWIIGHTDRFAAAVVAKPVINWYSWALTADMAVRGIRYWFPGPPWEHADHYLQRSPISYVGNVTTPTMLLTGEADYRTPMPESEQYYQALKLRKVEASLVRIPEASHGIATRPSHLIAKVLHILGWFDKYRVDD